MKDIALLDDKKTIKDLVEVDVYTKTLKFIEKNLKADEYNFVVSADNLAFAKTKMADLNKSIKFIDTFRKDKVNAESADIDLFKVNIKDYISPIELKREEIKKNVEVFEKETKDNILKELSLYSEQLIKEQNIRDNFIDIDIVDLIVLGSITSSGKLTKKARDVVESRVAKCKSKQDKYDMRLMQLENSSFKAGLETPLTLTHIQGIVLLDDDEVYETKLKELIASEIERQNTIQENLRKKANEEAQQKVINEQQRIFGIFANIVNNSNNDIDFKINEVMNMNLTQYGQFESYASEQQVIALNSLNQQKSKMQDQQKPEVETVYETIPSTQQEKVEQIQEVVEDDKKIVYIDVKLQFKVKDTVPSDKILNKVNQMLSAAGFNESLLSVEVV